jgi:5-phospho-D-xylono-1,4-lactonase
MTPVIRTVLGDLPPGQLGRTDYHEHLLQVSPLLPGDDLDDVDRAAEETELLRDAGIDALIELTPIGLGRDPLGLQAIAERTGVHVVMATGVHREAHYGDAHPVRALDAAALADRFVRDLSIGVDAGRHDHADRASAASPRAGVIKVGVGYWSISGFEHRVLAAASEAHARSGAAIVCHLELGTAAFEVLDVFTDAGVPAPRVVLAHTDRNPDPGLHTELAAAGAYLGYDGMGRTKYWPDSVLLDCLLAVAAAGGADRILLGGDVARRSSFTSFGGLPGMAYLPRRFVPRIERAGGPDLVRRLLVDNPARVFAMPAERPAELAHPRNVDGVDLSQRRG